MAAAQVLPAQDERPVPKGLPLRTCLDDLNANNGTSRCPPPASSGMEASDGTVSLTEEGSCGDQSLDGGGRLSIRPYSASSIPIRIDRSAWKVLPAPVSDAREAAAPPRAELDLSRSTASSQRSRGAAHRGVSFGTVRIRSYAQTVGDNPSVSIGTPIQLDWDYAEAPVLSVDDYESGLPRRRSARQMMLNYHNRRNILIHRWGCSETEVAEGEKQANAVRWQRHLTRSLLSVSFLEDFWESAVRKARRSLVKDCSDEEGT